MADERAELAAIAASLRAHLELQWDAGTTGIPRAPKRAAPARAPSPSPDPSPSPSPSPSASPSPSPNRSPNPNPFTAPFTAPATAPVTAPLPAAVPAPTAAPLRPLPVLADEVRACTKCGLSTTRTNTVFARGNPAAKLCFVGEAPGADEDAQGLPFVGRAGQLLDKMIAAMGLSPEGDVYVCNIIKCRPPENRRPTPEETAACIPYLHDQLANVSPKVIVALGNTAVQALLDTKLGITKLRGQWKLYRGILVMPTYHPSYLLREGPAQRTAKQEAWEDLQKVMKQLGLSAPKKP